MGITTALQIGSAICGLAAASPAIAKSSKFLTLYSFAGRPNDGSNPMASLISVKGVLYGTTYNGGKVNGEGTVYAIDPETGEETIVTSDMGVGPLAPVTFYKHSLFGTTYNEGNIFSVDVKTKEAMSLYTFPDGGDGEPASPNGLTAFGGKLFGSTFEGGDRGCGYVFSFSLTTDMLVTLHKFACGNGGANPEGSLILHKGLLYGVTAEGGVGPGGTIFSVNPTSGAEKTLHPFKGSSEGGYPTGIVFQSGLIYGSAMNGGVNSSGTLFSFDPATKKYITLLAFPGGAGGCGPVGAPVEYKAKLYGVTSSCGDSGNDGILYELSLKTGEEKVLHIFSNGLDGGSPFAGLLLYQGALYGTTIYGGTYKFGTVFKYVP
jgi:uncharacterized repeat protein (TIGR03803 family)